MSAGEAFEEVVETFGLLDEWEDRYRFLIELGRDRAGLPEADKVAANKVQGCTSQVWLTARLDQGRLHLEGDSDAHIVKGLVALLLLLYDGLTPEQALALDARGELARLDLEGHLSPSRANGLFSMVGRIRALASPPSP